MKPLKIAILGSTRGTNLASIVNAIVEKRLNAEIVVILSHKENAGILEKAKAFGLNAVVVSPHAHENRDTFDQRVLQVLKDLEVEVVVLIGYMRILSVGFIEAYRGRIINVHPSLLPKFKGLMDLAVHQAVLNQHELESGCSVHLVTEEVDDGQVLVQKKCPVYTEDDVSSLKARVQALEGPALIEAIALFNQKEKS